MKEKEKFDSALEDRRVMEKNLRRHRLSPTDYQKYLKSLEDSKDHGEEQVVYKEDPKHS